MFEPKKHGTLRRAMAAARYRLLRGIQPLFDVVADLGPYRLAIRPWVKINDINLAARVLDTEFFRKQLVPEPCRPEDLGSVLVVSPHQDDEAVGAGGLLIKASGQGSRVRIVYVMDGAQPDLPYTADEAIRIRNDESNAVCRMVGAESVMMGVSNLEPAPTLSDVDCLGAEIAELKPDVIMVPWLLDAPVKHRLTTHLLWLALKRRGGFSGEIWGYQVHNTLYPNVILDITDVIDRKRELIRCYCSQLEYEQRYDHLAWGMSAWNSRFLPELGGEEGERYAEVFFALPAANHLELIETFYTANLRDTYVGPSRLERHMTALHGQIVRG